MKQHRLTWTTTNRQGEGMRRVKDLREVPRHQGVQEVDGEHKDDVAATHAQQGPCHLHVAHVDLPVGGGRRAPPDGAVVRVGLQEVGGLLGGSPDSEVADKGTLGCNSEQT